MEKVTYSIHCDKYQKKKDGTSAIYMRITINRKTRYLPLNKFVQPEYFDYEKKRVKVVKSVPNAKALNRFFLDKETEIEDIILDLQRRDKLVSFDVIKRSFLGGGKDNFLTYSLNLLEEDSIDLKKTTIYGEELILAEIERYHPNLQIHEIDLSWLKKYKKHLIEEVGNKPNTLHNKFKIIYKYLKKAVKQGIIKMNPVEGFSSPRHSVDKPHLTVGPRL
ncbi:MAG: phage integrase SAM-like domain-containing protein [Flavobacteriales bacterium]|nr:phage integrase SAM-like domain-containing protein [Flavobacteriales bacterium]